MKNKEWSQLPMNEQLASLRKTADDRSQAHFEYMVHIVKSIHPHLDMPIKDIIDNLKITLDYHFIKLQLHIHFKEHRFYKSKFGR